MSFFSKLFKHSEEPEKEQTAIEQLASRYIYPEDEYWIPFGNPDKHYVITDTKTDRIFHLNVCYDFIDWYDMEKAEANMRDPKDDYFKVTATVSTGDEDNEVRYSFTARLEQKNFDRIINLTDARLALYDQLKEARADSSNPQRQQEAYLVSTLLRAVHDNVWIAPLTKYKEKLEQARAEVKAAYIAAQPKIEAYKEKNQKRKSSKKKEVLTSEQFNMQMSAYMQNLMRENLVDRN